MLKYLKHAWDFVVVCVRMHELLRDYFKGL